MEKKKILLIIVAFMVIIILLVFVKNRGKVDEKEDNEITTNTQESNIVMTDSMQYMIERPDGTEVYTNTIEEAEWYSEHPDYDPEPVHVD